MLKVEHLEAFNLDGALRGMRNPLNSWDKSDSLWCPDSAYFIDCHSTAEHCPRENECDFANEVYCVGKDDLALMKRLCKAGPEHRKFMRQIFVSMDVTSNHTFWAQLDTYKVGTTRNSCSKMHRIHCKGFAPEDFSTEGIDAVGGRTKAAFNALMEELEWLRQQYNDTKDKKYWRAMIDLLPMGYNIKATITMNYETVLAIIRQRSGHKMDEWHTLIDELMKLPYMRELSDACLNKMDAQDGGKAPSAPPTTGSNIKFHNEPSTDAIEKWYEENKYRIFRDWVTSPHLTSPPVLYQAPVNPPPWQITCQTAETHSDPNDRSVTTQANAEVRNDQKD